MTAVFSATWQTFRLGLRTSPSGRAALFTLRATLNPARKSKQHFQHFHSIRQSPNTLHGLSGPGHCSRTAKSTHSINSGPLGQSRWVSLWRRGQEPQEQESESDVYITEAEINKMFKQRMDPEEAIKLLMTLQRHRLEGTLDQKLAYPDSWIAKGLVWLRANHPVDEDAAIIARIDREIESGGSVPQSSVDGPHSVSQFEKLRRENKERDETERQLREAEEKREMEKASRTGEKRVGVQSKKPLPPLPPGHPLVQLKTKGTEWVDRYREKAEKQANEEAPENVVLSMSWMVRLLPSAAVALSVVGLSVLFAQNYTPPSRKARIWPDTPPAAATIITLIGMNVAVFLLWRVPPLWKSLNSNFIVAHAYPHCFSMIGAGYSHQSLSHLVSNMIGLWFIGTRVHDDIGRGPFLAVYFSCMAFSSYMPLVIQVMRGFYGMSSLGASGAVCGLLATACVLHEGRSITLPFLPPEWTRGIDTGVVLTVFMMMELLAIRKFGLGAAIVNDKTGRPLVDNLGHLFGYVAGIGAGATIRSYDPYWKNLKRHHFFTRDFGKHDMQASVPKSPPPG